MLYAPAPQEVVVRAGDRIALNVYMEPEMTDTFSVARTGEVFLPKLGPVQVADLPVGVAEDSLRRAYLAYLRNPSVNLTVLRRVGVHGEVRHPNLYLVDATVTLRDVIAQAGGLTDLGDPRKISLIRDGAEFPLPAGSAALVATELHSGDQVVVGRRSWFERHSGLLATSVPAFVLTFLTILDRFGR